jgi:predicted transcriptional regulator
MTIMINIKVDPKMRTAIKKLADQQFISMSAVIKQAIEKHLQDNAINWREEKENEYLAPKNGNDKG